MNANTREEFEKWLLAETGFDTHRTNFAMTKPEDQQYMCHNTNLAWLAWQAAQTVLLNKEMPTKTTPHISGLSGICDAGFSVKFPNGFDGEPDIKFSGLVIEGGGRGWSVACAMLAAANWLTGEAEKWESGNPYKSAYPSNVYFNRTKT